MKKRIAALTSKIRKRMTSSSETCRSSSCYVKLFGLRDLLGYSVHHYESVVALVADVCDGLAAVIDGDGFHYVLVFRDEVNAVVQVLNQ